MARKIRTKVTIRKKELPSNFFSLFKNDVKILANEKTRKFAKDIAKEAKETIRKQKFNWKPLNKAYKRDKERKGLDQRVYMATKDYVNKGIGYWEKEGQIFVGPKQGTHKPSGFTYQHLSRIHEYGTDTIPARPLWRPLLAVTLAKIKPFRKEYAKGVQRALNERIKKMAKKKKETKST